MDAQMKDFLAFAQHNWPLFAATAVITVMIVQNEVSRRTQGFSDLGPEAATRLLNHDDAVLLDIREDAEYRKDGRIANAVHIPLGELARRIGELEKYKGRPLIAYCRSGHRSRGACGLLRKQGFESIYNLAGGIMAWQNANLPVSKKK